MSNEAVVGTLIGAGIALGAGLLVHTLGDKGSPTPYGPITSAPDPPVMCFSANAKDFQPAFVKVAATFDKDGNVTSVSRFPSHNCAVRSGTVLTWSADTAIGAMLVQFVDSPTAPCPQSKAGMNPDQGKPAKMEAYPIGGTLAPLSLTVNQNVPVGTRFPYCMQVGGYWDPTPAIIVKE